MALIDTVFSRSSLAGAPRDTGSALDTDIAKIDSIEVIDRGFPLKKGLIINGIGESDKK